MTLLTKFHVDVHVDIENTSWTNGNIEPQKYCKVSTTLQIHHWQQ